MNVETSNSAAQSMPNVSLAKALFRNLRFAMLEAVANAHRIGAVGAVRFFWMRCTVPFGWPVRYFIDRRPASPAVARIDQEGFAELPVIDPEIVDSMLGRVLAKASSAGGAPIASMSDYAESMRRSGMQRQTALISDGSAECSLASIARSPVFAELATAYLELPADELIVEATIDTLVAVERRATPGGYDDALEFHRDIDAYKFLKIFVYLTDCEEGDGHHEVYLRSHRHFPRALIPIRRYHASEIERAIPQAKLKKVTGKAGFAFGENTLAFHRGTRPVRNHRVIFNLIYTEARFKDYYSNAFALSP